MGQAQPDQALLETAFVRHRGFVRQRMQALGVRQPDLDDATQDVFLVMARRLADFRRGKPMRNWAAGIARRVARRYRPVPGRGVIALEEIDEQRSRDQDDPEAQARRREALRVLEYFLRDLDEDRWKVFVLAEIEGLRGTEIADELAINVNTVYARLRSARRDFDRALRRHHAKTRRGLIAFLGLRLREQHSRALVVPLVALASLGALLLATVQLRSCASDEGAEDPQDASKPAGDMSRSPERRSIPPFVKIEGESEGPAPSQLTDPGDQTSDWVDAGSGHSFGEGWVAARNARYRVVDEKYLELEVEYVMDEAAIEAAAKLQANVLGGDPETLARRMKGNPMSCLSAEFITEGLEVIEGTAAWEMALAPGERKKISTTFEPTRDGIVRAALFTQSCEAADEGGGGTTTFVRAIAEDGTLRLCTEEDACGSWPHDDFRDRLHRDPLPQRATVEVINDCPKVVRYAVRADGRALEPDQIHELAPGKARLVELEGGAGLATVDEDGSANMTVRPGNERAEMRFSGPHCAVTAQDRTTVEVINDCPRTVRYVVKPSDRAAQPSDPRHEIAPGQTRTVEIDATDGFARVDEEGNASGGVWANGDNVRLRFTGPSCAMAISSGTLPRPEQRGLDGTQ